MREHSSAVLHINAQRTARSNRIHYGTKVLYVFLIIIRISIRIFIKYMNIIR